MAADELSDVHCSYGVVAERKADGQVAHVLCLGDVKSLHVFGMIFRFSRLRRKDTNIFLNKPQLYGKSDKF